MAPRDERVGPGSVGMVLAAVGSLQFGAALAGTLFDRIGPLGAVTLRLGLGALILLAVVRPRVRGLTAPQRRLALLFGLTLGAMNASIYAAFDRIPLGIAVTLEFVGPLGVAIATSRRRLDGLWVGLAALGIALIGLPALGPGGADALDPLGAAFGLLAGGCWAAYILLGARLGDVFPGSGGLALALVVGAVMVAPLGVADGGGALLDPGLLAVGVVVALLSSVIPYSLELEALRRMPARVFGVLMSTEPAVAAVAGYLVLGEILDPAQVVAVVLVAIASAGAAISARTPPPSV
jgi:inner membrane transporter RhtA